MKYLLILFLSGTIFLSCQEETSNLSEADNVLKEAVKAHGGDLYKQAAYEFDFRNHHYTFRNNDNVYVYTRKEVKPDSIVVDSLINGVFSRHVNGELAQVSEKKKMLYTESINSVVYFATLPSKLQDDAVNLKYMGSTQVRGSEYDVLEVTFDEEGGGVDHDDNYYYWINKSTNLIGFLAYNFTVNDGGVRFREANNTRDVEGIIFQDYINYKAEVGTPLADLPKFLEKNELVKLSEINTENVVKLK